MSRTQALRCLERRLSWLEERLSHRGIVPGDSYDREEVSALRLAIRALELFDPGQPESKGDVK